MSYQFPASSSTALNFDVGNLGPLENTAQQDSGPSNDSVSSADFQCEECSKVFSKQYELTLVSLQKFEKVERSLPFAGSIHVSIQSL